MKRRRFIKGAGVATTAGIAGCAGGLGGGSDKLALAIISGPGGFGDKAYNDKALQGLNKAKEKFDATVKKVETTGTGEYRSLQSRLAESSNPDYDLIVCVGFYQAKALKKNAKEYPDQKWMIINQGLFKENGEHFSNVAGYVWANHQMSFQAGVLAGTMTSRDFSAFGNSTKPDKLNVGFVGGRDTPLIRAFERAYVKGVKTINSDVKVQVAYAGSFSDPAAGKEAAIPQYQNGADIIYHAAAGTGPGIFQAAQERDRFAIGVDADQSKTLPKYSKVIMGSAVKFINKGTFKVAKGIQNDNWDKVNGKHVLGLKQDAVKLVLGKDVGPKLPGVVNQNLKDTKGKIVNGNLTVPCSATGCMK